MAINSKTFRQIKSLHRNGVSLELTLTMIISLSDSPNEAAKKIVEFLTPPELTFPVGVIDLTESGKE